MLLSAYQRFAYRFLGPAVARHARKNLHLRMSLQKARIALRSEVYLAYAYLNMLVAFGGMLLVLLMLAALRVTGIVGISSFTLILLTPLPIVLAGAMYLLTFVLPDMRASTRARDIEARLPYALNFVSTMASAGIAPAKIFQTLAQQPVYGEVAREAAWIARDIQVLGHDLISALTAAIDRSPSVKFQDFLQGTITALTSGEDVKMYFQAKSAQFVYENRQVQKRFLESLSILAESYVTVVVAAPLFLIVLLSVFMMFGGAQRNMLQLGYALVTVFIPLAQFGFGVSASGMTPEA